ncbi:hypothetical protein ACH8KY_002873 [Salmonella enterica subsp. enterica serovar Braenderup]
MWRQVNIAIPPDATAITCSQMAVHPWDAQHGHITPDGCYLNPVNALKGLAGKLNGVDSHHDIIILMVCAGSMTEFTQHLEGLSAVLPLPALKQTARRARTQISQAAQRMIIPDTPVSGMPAPEALNISTLRDALTRSASAAALSTAGMADISQLKNALTAFQQQREQLTRQLTESMQTPPVIAKAWAFTATGDINLAGVDMLKNIPHPSSSLTYAHMFTGDLSGMMNWLSRE